MQQVLFHLPFTSGLFGPDGVPVYGFGAMLFLTFVVVAMVWGPRRAKLVGMPDGRLQDLAIILFVTGIAGARLVYMLQYRNQYSANIVSLAKEFVQIWNGGIVVYGAVFGGLLGYAGFWWFVLRKFRISGWKLADVVAPLIATGMAIGRIGCYLNGCCWGQPACPETLPVPLVASLGQFPLLPAHSREQVCLPATDRDRMPQIRGLQTTTGFALTAKPAAGLGDPRAVVLAVEPGSAALAAGILPGDRIVGVEGEPNAIVVELLGTPEALAAADRRIKDEGGVALPIANEEAGGRLTRYGFTDAGQYRIAYARTADLRAAGLSVFVTDRLNETVRNWPRGKSALSLEVISAGQTEPHALTFVPRTVGFFPTQLYETVSMALLVLVLIAFQPIRRHDGQMMVLLMLGYAAHRFLNEALRIEPTYALDLTLSQWISLGIIGAAALMELFLRSTMPKLAKGLQPLGPSTSVPGSSPPLPPSTSIG